MHIKVKKGAEKKNLFKILRVTHFQSLKNVFLTIYIYKVSCMWRQGFLF